MQITIEFSDRSEKRLAALVEKTGAKSAEMVIREALWIAEAVVETIIRGSALAEVKNGEVAHLIDIEGSDKWKRESNT